MEEEIVNGSVKFTGIVSPKLVYEILSKSSIFVYPTHIDSFGLVIAEAMMNGAVPVVSHLEGITDQLVDNEINGYLVKVDDVNGFVDRIQGLLQNPAEMNAIGLKAREKAKKIFSLKLLYLWKNK